MTAPSFRQLNKCERCNGTGTVPTRFGVPGTAIGYVPGAIVEEGEGYNVRKGSYYANSSGDYENERTYVECGVCLGTGWRKTKKERPTQGDLHIHSSKGYQMSLDEIAEVMGLDDLTEKEQT